MPLITPNNALQIAQQQMQTNTPAPDSVKPPQAKQIVGSTESKQSAPLSTFNQATAGMNVNERQAYRNSISPVKTEKTTSTPTQDTSGVKTGGGVSPIQTTPEKLPTLGIPQKPTGTVKLPYEQASSELKGEADYIIDTMDPTGVMDSTIKNDLKNAYVSGDTGKIQDYINQNEYDIGNIKDFISAYRTTRDANITEERNKQTETQRTEQTTQQFNTQIEQQKQNIRKQQLANDMMMSTSGRGQSQNLTDTIISELTMQQSILQNLSQSKDWALSSIAKDAEYSNKILANQYNDAMSQYTLAVQNKMKTLEDTGLAKTAEGLSAMRSTIEQTNLNKLALSQTYAQQLQFLTESLKQKADAKKFDLTQTQGYNDGYLHGVNGDVITGPNGKPLAYNPEKTIKSTFNDNGVMYAVYSDNTVGKIYEGTPASDMDVMNYANAIKSAGASGDSLLKSLPEQIQQQVLSYMGKSGMSIGVSNTPVWQEWVDSEGINHAGWVTPGVNPTVATGSIPGSFTGDTISYIASKEGFRAQAYDDATGKTLLPGQTPIGVATIGYGTTSINGKPVQPGMTISQEDAQKYLSEDISKHSNWKNYIDENTLSPSQKTALASFEYNLGSGIWDKSAMNIIDMIKSGDLAGAGKEMQKYVNAGGKFVQGLANRRAEEGKLLMNTQGTSTIGTQESDKDKSILDRIIGAFTGKEESPESRFTDSQIEQFKKFGVEPPKQYRTNSQKEKYMSDYAEWSKGQAQEQEIESEKYVEQILQGNASLPAKNTKKGQAIREYMAKNELFDKGTGNESYYDLKPADRSDIVQIGKMREDIDEVNRIVNKRIEDGTLDEMLGGLEAGYERFKTKTGLFTDDEFRSDFNKLDSLLGSAMVDYIQSKSGLTVSDKERENLLRLLPNLDQSESNFIENLKLFTRGIERNEGERLQTYGFDSIDSLRNASGIGNNVSKTGANIQKDTDSQVEELINNF